MFSSWRSFQNSTVLVMTFMLVAGGAAIGAAPTGTVNVASPSGFSTGIGRHKSVRSQKQTSGEASVSGASTSSVGSQGVTDSPTTALATGGLTIQATFDVSISGNANSAAIQAMINRAISLYPSLFSDPVTVTILFRYATTSADGTAFGAGVLAESIYGVASIPWSMFLTDLTADAKTPSDASANASITTQLGTNVRTSTANERALGINQPGVVAANGTCCTGTLDGIVTINSAHSFQFDRTGGIASGSFDAQRTTEHEIDEILGLGSILNVTGGTSDVRPQDLFSWSAAGKRNITATGVRYFSINSGTTNRAGFNQESGGDFGDWLSGTCPQTTPYVQNAFSCMGQSSDVESVSPEGVNLDVIGYDLVSVALVPAAGPGAVGCLAGLFLVAGLVTVRARRWGQGRSVRKLIAVTPPADSSS